MVDRRHPVPGELWERKRDGRQVLVLEADDEWSNGFVYTLTGCRRSRVRLGTWHASYRLAVPAPKHFDPPGV